MTTTATFTSVNPATGEPIAQWPEHSAADVDRVVAQAAVAQRYWAALSYRERRARMDAWRGELARGLEELAALLHEENGKPRGDAILEIMVALDHIGWSAAKAAKVLGPRKVPAGFLALNHAATTWYEPYGVVGVIGPWNYPVLTPMGSLTYALAAGNAVVFKPSEFTPGVGAYLVAAWRRAAPDMADVLQLVTGGGATGAALCAAAVQKIGFTGSAATGRKVMAACAQSLVPVLMECGGKDAMIVTDDANLGAAAEAALWGGMSNAGQTCLGIERVYVTACAYQPFVKELLARAASVMPGEGPKASYGPITMPAQVDVIRDHLADALARGGRVAIGGTIDGSWVAPTILLDVPETSRAVREETFGPVLTVTRVANEAEAIQLANGTSYGLGGSVFAGSGHRGAEIARQLRAGMTSVNSVMTFASVPSLPMGGLGESGFGRIHGPDGLREFARSRAVTRQRFPLPVVLASFARSERITNLLASVVRWRHARH